MRRLATALVFWFALGSAAEANWLDRLWGGGGEAGQAGGVGWTGKLAKGTGSIEHAAAHIRKLPAKGDGALAAATTPEGHWRFVNKAGETYTVGTPDEMGRVVGVLLPELAAKPDARLAIYLTEAAIHTHKARLAELPKAAELHLVVDRDSYRLARQGDGAAARLHAEVRTNLLVEIADRRLFEEALWQLARPLNKADIRVLALEPGGPVSLGSVPRFDAASKRALVDTLDPARLVGGLAAARGQTVLVTGRIDGGALHFQPASGPERSVRLAELTGAAEAADVNLVILEAATPRQPGGRNWLWRRIDVAGLEQAATSATFADFLGALAAGQGSGQGRLTVTTTLDNANRAILQLLPARTGASAPIGGGIGEAMREMVSGVTGSVVVKPARAYTSSRERQTELDSRLLPWLPSLPQYLYLGGLVLGVLGWRVARGWWARVWPPAGTPLAGTPSFADRLRSAPRWAAFLLIFLPLAGLPAAIAAFAHRLWSLLTAPARLLHRLRVWRRAA